MSSLKIVTPEMALLGQSCNSITTVKLVDNTTGKTVFEHSDNHYATLSVKNTELGIISSNSLVYCVKALMERITALEERIRILEKKK